ncbi:tumor necrosis factor receptor superfamily member 14-like isoform X1 [Salvelinus namaycush]|uniref:Tumor necrosis factor receptor superfamily member 14-like isoform X1 n=1 Tax=Salvelinus namaycush TaxID=8040 RepID=A0A8U1BUG0_SALNM|nr:tumor necrosis factor receptor superfamily member 14-like isoform X1 [Salvelinus namaycush]
MVYLSSAQYFLIGLNFMHVFGSDCGPAEYKKSDGQCCPMCGRGLVVRRDCTIESSTSCIPCIRGTFMNEANGLTKCFPCSPCDTGQGLFTQTECKPTSNTVCDVLDGFYCRSYSSNSKCSFAVEHTHCSAGQSTKSPGTKTTDTMCEDCQHGFYSQHDVNCTAWTDCAAMGHVKTKDGNSSEDVICNKVPPRSHVTIIAPILLLGLTVTVLFCFYLARAKCKKELHVISEVPVQETGHVQVTSNSLVETAENVPGNVVTD